MNDEEEKKRKKRERDLARYYNKKDEILAKQKIYRLNNKDAIKQANKIYRIDNKNKIKQYLNDNKEKIKQRTKTYYLCNQDKIKENVKLHTQMVRKISPFTHLIQAAKKRSKLKGIPFDLTKEWAKSVWTGYCELTGLPFDLSSNDMGGTPYSASIDRIDNAKGYTIDNCRFILNSINAFKFTMNDSEMKEVAVRLLDSLLNKDNEVHNKYVLDEQRIKFLKKRYGILLTAAKGRAKKRALDFDLDKDWINSKLTGKCELTNIDFVFKENRTKGATSFSPSIDRIDSNKGYTKDNCRVILFAINAFKQKMTDKELLPILTNICENL